MEAAPNQGHGALAVRLAAIRERIGRAAIRAGRPRDACALVAVIKQQPDAEVASLLDLGVVDLGENRVQAMVARPPEILARARMHLIGPLQTNKARKALRVAACFHALDSERLAALLNDEAAALPRDDQAAALPRRVGEASALERRLQVYLQVNVAGEVQKHGCAPDAVAALARAASRLTHLEVLGLMTMAPFAEDPERSRPVFRALAQLSKDLRASGDLPAAAAGLSMGMSADFEVAVEEGATVTRIGSALFHEGRELRTA